MYTIKQIRDLFYGLLNQSEASSIQGNHGEDIEELKKRCTQLGVDDSGNAVIAKEMGDNLKDLITHNYNKAEATQTGNEKKQQSHHKMLREHGSLHDKEKEAISELKLNLTTLMDQCGRLDSKLEKTKGNLQEEQLRTRTEIFDKIEHNDRWAID